MSYSYSQPQIGTTGIFTFILVTRLLFTHTYYFRTIPLSPDSTLHMLLTKNEYCNFANQFYFCSYFFRKRNRLIVNRIKAKKLPF